MGGMTTGQVARRLGYSAEHVRRLLAAGRLRGVRTALGTLVNEESIAELERLRRERA